MAGAKEVPDEGPAWGSGHKLVDHVLTLAIVDLDLFGLGSYGLAIAGVVHLGPLPTLAHDGFERGVAVAGGGLGEVGRSF